MEFSFLLSTRCRGRDSIAINALKFRDENLYLKSKIRRKWSLFIKCFLYNHINAIVKDADSPHLNNKTGFKFLITKGDNRNQHSLFFVTSSFAIVNKRNHRWCNKMERCWCVNRFTCRLHLSSTKRRNCVVVQRFFHDGFSSLLMPTHIADVNQC